MFRQVLYLWAVGMTRPIIGDHNEVGSRRSRQVARHIVFNKKSHIEDTNVRAWAAFEPLTITA